MQPEEMENEPFLGQTRPLQTPTPYMFWTLTALY